MGNVWKVIGRFLLIFLLFLFACAPTPFVGQTFYTKVNIWYNDSHDISTVNYHKGPILPVGTKVTITAFKKKKPVSEFLEETNQPRQIIQFVPDKGKVVFTIVFLEYYSSSQISLGDIFNQYFSEQGSLKENGLFNKFSVSEQENIIKGTITEGMCKEAVLMAYGYPPSHKTPSLESNIWIYWKSRFNKLAVEFRNDRVISITD